MKPMFKKGVKPMFGKADPKGKPAAGAAASKKKPYKKKK